MLKDKVKYIEDLLEACNLYNIKVEPRSSSEKDEGFIIIRENANYWYVIRNSIKGFYFEEVSELTKEKIVHEAVLTLEVCIQKIVEDIYKLKIIAFALGNKNKYKEEEICECTCATFAAKRACKKVCNDE